jgi:hypothetical protein
MTIEQFWNIVEKVHHASRGDFDYKCELLEQELRKLPLAEVQSFDTHFTDCLYRAYTWELWAAAYIIGSGCSDDSFWDFRSTLISMGHDTFERALEDPEALVDVASDEDDLQMEGYQYVAGKVAEALGGDLPPPRPHPKEPAGEPWEEDTVAELYPKLAEKFWDEDSQ